MHIALERKDVLQLIDAGEIVKAGVTITMQESRREAVAVMAWNRAHPELTDGTFTRRRPIELGREVKKRSGNPFSD
jgi:hypothetical protein